MKTLRFALYLMMLSVFAACGGGGEDEPTPTPEPQPQPTLTITSSVTAPVLEQKGGKAEVEFTSSAAWTASVSEGRAASWVSVAPTSGSSGKHTLTVTATENTTTDERNATVTLKAGTTTKSFTVSQKQKDALTVTSNKIEVNAEGGEAEIEVKANVDYSYEIEESAQSWIAVSKTRALKTTTIVLQIAENEDTAKREGKITIQSGELSEVVTVYQEGSKPSIVLTQNEYAVGSAGETIKVELKSNVDYEVELPNGGWITESTSRAISTHTHYFDIAPNEGYDARTDSIFFMNKENGIREKVTVTQVQQNAIIVAQNEYSLEATGGELDFVINTNVDFSVSVSVDWIKQVESRGLTEKPLHFDIAENTAEEAREGKITITDGEIVQEILVEQEAARDYEAEERAALIAFYEAAGGKQWLHQDNWCSDKPLNEWYGITMDDRGYVTGIRLLDIGLDGDFTEMIRALCPLKKLTVIYMGGNNDNVHGKFPDEIYNFTNLETLDMDRYIEGEMTSQIVKLKKLRRIALSGVKVSTNVLREMSKTLTDLNYICLSYAEINGPIPEEIGSLEKLNYLGLPNADIEGELPNALWELPLLSGIVLEMNPKLSGTIPISIKNLKNLWLFNLQYCSLEGHIPSEIGDCSKLETIFLNDNKLEGEIPSSIGNLENLQVLYLQNNNLTGNIPVSMSQMPNLLHCSLFGNRLSGEVPEEICDIWQKWTPFNYITPQQEGYILTYKSVYTSTDYSKDGEVQLIQKHTEGKGIPMILLGDAFVDKDMEQGGAYDQAMQRAMEAYFSTEPMTSLRPLFDVYSVRCVSENNYIGGNTALETYHTCMAGGNGNFTRILKYASLVLDNLEDALINIAVNDQQQLGYSFFLDDNCTVTFTSLYDSHSDESQNFEGVFRHEAIGHGFGLLGDEYGAFVLEIGEEDKRRLRDSQEYHGRNLNLDVTNDSTQILWSKFLFDPRYKNEDLGIHEGGWANYSMGVYRPSVNSIMRFNEPIFNAPSREAIYKRAMKLAYGDSWEYDYETFVKWDMEHYPTTSESRVAVQGSNSEWVKKHHSPVIINRTSAEILRQGNTVFPFR